MRFYKIDVQGKMLLERKNPAGEPNDQGRFLFNTVNSRIAFNDGSAFRNVWDDGNMGSGSGLDADTLRTLVPGNANGNIPISNGTVNANLNAALLEGQDGDHYLNATNLNAGTVPAARLSGLYNINISGNAGSATTAKYA